MQHHLKAYAAVLAAVVFWGISFVATKVAFDGVSPYMLLVVRFATAVCLLIPLWFVYSRERLYAQDLVFFVLLGLMEPGLYYLLETWGLVYTSASMASLIIASIPVFVTLMAALFLKESLGPRIILGILMTLMGVVSLIRQDLLTPDVRGGALFGNLLILGAAFCASIYTIVSRRLRAKYQTITLTLIQFGFATLFFLPFAVREWWWEKKTPHFSTEVILAVLFLAVFATLIAFLLYNYGLGKLEASRVAVFINVIPLITVLTAWMYLGEKLSWIQAIGGGFILLGVSVTTRGSNPKPMGSSEKKSGRSGFRFSSFLSGRIHKGRFSFIAAKEYVKGSHPSVTGTRRYKGKHQPF